MSTYIAQKRSEDVNGRTTIEVAFGPDKADNDKIVPDAIRAIEALELQGGRLICIDGAASLPAAMAIAHAVCHLYSYVACYDPKLHRFVVAIAHGPEHKPGELLPF